MWINKKFIQPFLNFLFPPVCINCGVSIPRQKDFLCQKCLAKISFIQPVVSVGKASDSFDFLITVAKFDAVTVSLVHNLKFFSFKSVGKYIAMLIFQQIRHEKISKKIDIITPVPLHFVRKKERGYNQCHIIGKELARLLNCEYKEKILSRAFYTKSQAKLKHEKRSQNIDKAFVIKDNIDCKGKNIAVIDDVFTTGSTMNECCNTIKLCNPNKVIAVTFCKA